MKPFDAVETMRNVRAQLSERYIENAKQQFEDLRRIREEYGMHQPPLQPKVLR